MKSSGSGSGSLLLGLLRLLLPLTLGAGSAGAQITGSPDQLTINGSTWSVHDIFDNYTPPGVCAADGSSIGTFWVDQFSGFGCVQILTSPSRIELMPAVSTRANETHAALVTSNLGGVAGSSDVQFEVQLETIKQLRTSRRGPNPWEVGWVAWKMRLDPGCNCWTFYAFVPKTNGWELDKIINANGVQTQTFLVTSPKGGLTFPIGQVYDIRITDQGGTINVFANGVQINLGGPGGAFVDSNPLGVGDVGLYCEDSQVDWLLVNAGSL
jgi:hypothetical protein